MTMNITALETALAQQHVCDVPEGWDREGLRLAILESVIEPHRYHRESDRIMSCHGDCVETLFPSVEELSAQGVNLEDLARCFANGMTGEGFASTHASLDIETLNWALAQLVEREELVRQYPDPIDRFLQRVEESDCRLAAC